MDEQASTHGVPVRASEAVVREMFAHYDAALAFGPSFFLTQLGAYVRDRCPDIEEALPFVHVHLAGGESLDVCHVIGLAPRWVALAVYEPVSRAMRTECVPYEAIVRITISPGHAQGDHMGFYQEADPALQETAEETFWRAATRGGEAGRQVDVEWQDPSGPEGEAGEVHPGEA